jgi:predicted RNA binding protein YcfA (HicA-like mRNA interferase family)
MTFRRFIQIIVQHGFCLNRQRGSHRIYKRVVGREVRLVVVAFHRESDEIKPGTLASMIRQSGLDKKLFK